MCERIWTLPNGPALPAQIPAPLCAGTHPRTSPAPSPKNCAEIARNRSRRAAGHPPKPVCKTPAKPPVSDGTRPPFLQAQVPELTNLKPPDMNSNKIHGRLQNQAGHSESATLFAHNTRCVHHTVQRGDYPWKMCLAMSRPIAVISSMGGLLCGVWRRPHLGTLRRGGGRPPHHVNCYSL